jgi:hypothetical protein
MGNCLSIDDSDEERIAGDERQQGGDNNYNRRKLFKEKK